MEVLSGRMIFYFDGKELVTSADDPPLLIPRGHVHGFTVSSYLLSLPLPLPILPPLPDINQSKESP
jgi:hypothetical protein